MPPKPKRLPKPVQHHLKHSKQLLEDFLFQYLPHLSGLGAVSRLNLYTWFSGSWGLSPDASAGLPYMVLEALRLQRHYLLSNKLALKPLSLSLLGEPDDKLQAKALPLLQEINSQSHTAKINYTPLAWQEQLRQLQLLLQRQPAAERNLLLLDPLNLSLPSLAEFLPLLPRRLDVLLVLPTAAIRHAGGLADKTPPHETALLVAEGLAPLLAPAQQEENEQEEEQTTLQLVQKLREALSQGSNRYMMHYQQRNDSPVVLLGSTPDTLMMEKMLFSRHKLEQQALEQMQAGNQLGLFKGSSEAASAVPSSNGEKLLELLASQAEWNNQELYSTLLHNELLPQEMLPLMQSLIAAKQLEVLDEKKKKLKEAGALPITQTAFKLPVPSRYFRLKQ